MQCATQSSTFSIHYALSSAFPCSFFWLWSLMPKPLARARYGEGTFTGCDVIENARALFTNIEKTSDAPSTCGTIRNTVSIYVKEVETLLVVGGRITIHLVKILADGMPEQYVATFIKLEDM